MDQQSKNSKFTIWIDNDACPRKIRDIVLKAAERLKIPVKLVANSYMKPPQGSLFEMICVDKGFDVADQYIAEHVAAFDIVITADVPLADQLVDKDAVAISPRGKVFDRESIKEHLALRNLSHELRGAGEITSGPRSLGHTDVKNFAGALDRLLTKHMKKKFSTVVR